MVAETVAMPEVGGEAVVALVEASTVEAASVEVVMVEGPVGKCKTVVVLEVELAGGEVVTDGQARRKAVAGHRHR